MARKRTSRSTGRNVNVALIGAGQMANLAHYPSLSEIEEVKLVGLCDLVPKKLKDTADRFGIDVEEAIEQKFFTKDGQRTWRSARTELDQRETRRHGSGDDSG